MALIVVVSAASIGWAGPKFRANKIEGLGSEVLFCDLDGDRLEDLVLLEGTNVAVFFQGANRGFSKEPHQRCGWGNRPALVWVAHLGHPVADSPPSGTGFQPVTPDTAGQSGTGLPHVTSITPPPPAPANSLLFLTSEGVAQLRFGNRTSPPTFHRLIQQPTVVPPTFDAFSALALHFPLSVRRDANDSLMLVPADESIQVWRHGRQHEWQLAQRLEPALDLRFGPSMGDHAGYVTWLGLSLSVGDVNGDAREDLIIRRHNPTGTAVYTVYLQGDNGLFEPEPTLIYETKPDWRSWLCWMDVNRDGKVDLIKSTWLNEPWFVPGVRSGKVLVGIHLADERGQLSSAPQQVFRKNDWTPAVPVPDIDGDGLPDLVLGYSLFDSREGARKMITAKQLDFSLKFHFYRRGSGYSKEPDCQREVVIHLDRHSLHLGADRRESFERFVNFNGDFNGDGKRDLLVRDRSDQVSVYFFLSRERGFSRQSALQFNCPEPIQWLQTRDLNGDGASDLVVNLERRRAFRVFLSEDN